MGAELFPAEGSKSWGISLMLVCIDHSWRCAVASVEGVAEEPFSCLSILLSCEEKIQGVSILVNSSIQPLPLAFDLYVDFIHSLKITSGTQMMTAALV